MQNDNNQNQTIADDQKKEDIGQKGGRSQGSEEGSQGNLTNKPKEEIERPESESGQS